MVAFSAKSPDLKGQDLLRLCIGIFCKILRFEGPLWKLFLQNRQFGRARNNTTGLYQAFENLSFVAVRGAVGLN